WITVGETERALAGAGTPPVRYSTLAVRDSGTGMSEETRRRAFEPFYTTKPTGKGTGLGLPMVFGTMEQLGGWVEVESAPGAGTTITLGFARASGAERRDTPLPPPRPATAGLPRIVLLVEDNVALRRVARRSLENAGCRVFVAADGEEGFRVWEAHRAEIDLLVTDAVMPLCGGPDLIRRIRRAGGTCEMVLASGYASEDFADLEGDLTILPKPWTRQELLAVVGKAPDVPAA
ncbi:MAG TPA: response regulator, partial [Gemmatimonadales bacterium]|nr:response regulator [Gemmatimonadales bacterium]